MAGAVTTGGRARAVAIRAVAASIAAAAGAAAGAGGLGDPTQPPPGYAAPQRPGDPQAPGLAAPEPVRVQMIARQGSTRLAVVNGHRVRPGDAIALDGRSAKVVAIRDDAVVLDRDGSRQIVELVPHARTK